VAWVERKDHVHRAYSELTALPVAEVQHHRWPPFDGAWVVTFVGMAVGDWYQLADAKAAWSRRWPSRS
jgi:hypothetical protein